MREVPLYRAHLRSGRHVRWAWPNSRIEEIGILLPKNQRQHRTLHIQEDMLPYAVCELLCPVSAALASISRKDSIFTSYASRVRYRGAGFGVCLTQECVCVCGRGGERVCVCVEEVERERERDSVCVCVCRR